MTTMIAVKDGDYNVYIENQSFHEEKNEILEGKKTPKNS